MPLAVALTLEQVLLAYAGGGLVVATLLLAVGLRRIDAAAAAAPWRVRLLLVPGLVALWPVMLWRLAGGRPVEGLRAQRRAHRLAWLALAMVVPATVMAGLHARRAPAAEATRAGPIQPLPPSLPLPGNR